MPHFSARRVLQNEAPFAGFHDDENASPWVDEPHWPCSWVRVQELPAAPYVIGYRLNFILEAPRRFRVHVSGDERYEFFVNGTRLGRGPARAPQGRWHYESYELDLPVGEHKFNARVHTLGALAPWAQTSYGHGWLLAPEPPDLWEQIGTGRAPWEAKLLNNYKFIAAQQQVNRHLGCGPLVEVQATTADWMTNDANWSAVATSYAGNNGFTLYLRPTEPLLSPTPIPPQRTELHSRVRLRDFWSGGGEEPFPDQFAGEFDPAIEPSWIGLFNGGGLTIKPHQKIRVLLDFEDYVAAFPTLTTSGGRGAVIRLGWSEALVTTTGQKGNRALVAGLLWSGISDTFLPDGEDSRRLETFWWRCGRYLLLEIETKDQPLRLEGVFLEKTNYPLTITAQWTCSWESWDTLFGICQRSLESCMHETYVDCPYYEQLQYLGDTRLQILLTYVLSGDDRLARHALTTFAVAQHNPTGWMPSNHPSSLSQRIPPFPLWWVAMLHDFGRWRGDKAFVKSLLPTARRVVDIWLENLQDNGLVSTPRGWNFVEAAGHLLDIKSQFSGVLNWHLAYTLRHLADLEEWCDELELAARARRLAGSIAWACEIFWDSERGLYADDLEHTQFSEHGNCLAVLSGLLPNECRSQLRRTLFENPDLVACSIYFSHYLFETAAALGRLDVLDERLAPWLELAGQGFVTTPETFGESRSDCHAWGAHPLYHYFVSMLGIRPAGWGFDMVEIIPQLGSLPWAQGKMPHPRGEIEVDLRREGTELIGMVSLPAGLHGRYLVGNASLVLYPGKQTLRMTIENTRQESV